VTTEVRAFSATIPAGTAKASPLTFDMSFPTRQVDRVDITIPPGNNGTVGFQIANAGVQMIPYNRGAFLVGNGQTLAVPLTGAVTSGSWQLIGYNTGQFDHTLYVIFYLSTIDARGTVDQSAAIADVAGLSAPPGDVGIAAPLETVPAAPSEAEILANPPPSGPFVGGPPPPPPRV
jgi:hypothetical protein